MKEMSGISAASGIAIGRAFLYFDDIFSQIPRYTINKKEIDSEWQRFIEAVQCAELEVKDLHTRALNEMGDDHAKIFEAHLLMLADVELHEQVQQKLNTEIQNIEWIIYDISRDLSQKLSAAQDPYLRERAIDIYDVSRRLLNQLMSVNKVSLNDIKEDVILVTHNLLPSDALTMNKEHVKGIVMDMGGKTSHTAILARAFDIPAVLGLSTATMDIQDGDQLIVDGSSGKILLDPDEKSLRRYERLNKELKKTVTELAFLKDLYAESRDGKRVILKANIEIPEEAEHALENGAEGIGLYRSEFLFLTPGQSADEEKQYQTYQKVLHAMSGKPVTIRTLDVGGDKLIPDLQANEEKNPLLGWRAIRFCLSHKELFKTQLRALLRASSEGDVRIMFPMISGLEELQDALDILEEAKDECRARGQRFAEDLKVGTMIEIPSAAMTADILAKHSDFFSIGTNDLIQYSIAVDRGNERIAYLAQPFHPAMLRFIKNTIDSAHAAGITAAMCGELAGDPVATPILFGLGLDEFSMSASSIPLVKKIIRNTTAQECKELSEEAMRCSSYHAVDRIVKTWISERFPSD